MLAVDELVDALFEELEAQKITDNTYVFFTSDNGFQLGHHRLIGKKDPFDRVTRVQLIVRGPSVPAGKTIDHLVSHIDLIPTFLEIGGGARLHFLDGKSFVPLLKDPAAHDERSWQRGILIENYASKLISRIRLDLNYKALRRFSDFYVEWKNGDREYYDLVKDPFQIENSWLTLAPQTQRKLEQQLAKLKSCAGRECLNADNPGIDPIDTAIELKDDATLIGGNVNFSGVAEDDEGVERVEIVLRAVWNRHYLDDDDFGQGYKTIDAKLTSPGARTSRWNVNLKLSRAGLYWISARAFDVEGNEDVVIPNVFFNIVNPADSDTALN